MRSISPFSRRFSSSNQFGFLLLLLQETHFPLHRRYSTFTEDVCGTLLDGYPDIKKLKGLHLQIITSPSLSLNLPLSIKLMRAYALLGNAGDARQVFEGVPEKNIIFYNVMIRSYANNHLFGDAIVVYKRMLSDGVLGDNYTYPCVLKACSGSINLVVGVQTHAQIVKVGLILNLFVGNGLIAVYGKCGYLADARKVLEEMPGSDVVSWNSMVAGYAQNGFLEDTLSVCREMELLGIKPDAGTMASLFPIITSTSSNNVSFMEDMFSGLTKKNLISWNVMISMYANNSMPEKALLFS